MVRATNIEKLLKETFDLIIIGGGITGAGVLQEAQKRGYKVLLIEKGDFASGTSSKSAKLIHGGLRYLQYFHFGLVKDSLRERNYLLEEYPHLVKPIEFVYPLYESGFKFRIGMMLYQLMGKHRTLPGYQFLSKKQTLKKYDAIDRKGLKGSFSYFDGITNDSRLTSEIISEAVSSENATAMNYLELVSGERINEQYHLLCKDHIEQIEFTLKTNYILNCSGPWTDIVLNKFSPEKPPKMAPSKGVHLVFSGSRIKIKNALAFSSYADDGRKFYALPWENDAVIIGVTDTDFNGNPDEVHSDQNDLDYMLHAINQFLPDSNITEKDILYQFAGLRPLFKEGQESKDKARDFKVWWSKRNVLNIAGGKLTTYRTMAKAMLNELPPKANQQPPVNVIDTELTSKNKVISRHLIDRYGKRAPKLFNLINEEPEEGNWISTSTPLIKAEITYLIREHQCYYLDDILDRRLSVGYVISSLEDQSAIIYTVAEILQKERNLTESEINSQLENYRNLHHLKLA